MSSYQVVIPPHIAAGIRSLHPDLKRFIKSAVRAIATDPTCGEPLLRELDGFWKFRVRRFRIAYAIDQRARIIRLMAVGHRQSVYEELTARLRNLGPSTTRLFAQQPSHHTSSHESAECKH